MPWRSRAIAAVRSVALALQACRAGSSISALSCSAIRLTGPMPSRSRSSVRAEPPARRCRPLRQLLPHRRSYRASSSGARVEPLADLLAQPRQAFVCRLALSLAAGRGVSRARPNCCSAARAFSVASRSRVSPIASRHRRCRANAPPLSPMSRRAPRLSAAIAAGGAASSAISAPSAVLRSSRIARCAAAPSRCLRHDSLSASIAARRCRRASSSCASRSSARPRLGFAAARRRCLSPRRFQFAARQLRSGQGAQRALRLGDLGGDVRRPRRRAYRSRLAVAASRVSAAKPRRVSSASAARALARRSSQPRSSAIASRSAAAAASRAARAAAAIRRLLAPTRIRRRFRR